jgi:hypothetical protein
MSYESTVILALSCLVAILLLIIAHRQYLLSQMQFNRGDPKIRFEGDFQATPAGNREQRDDSNTVLQENLEILEERFSQLADSVERLSPSENGDLEATMAEQAERITRLGAQLSRLKGEVTRVKKEFRGQLAPGSNTPPPATRSRGASAGK